MKTVKLGDVCDFKARANERLLPFVGMEDVESGTGRFKGSLTPREVKSATSYFDDSCVLYGKLRPYLNKVLVPDFEGHCSTEFVVLRPDMSMLDRKYLWHFLISSKTVEILNGYTTGTRMPRADLNVLKSLVLPLPSLEEQRRGVERLDAAFEKIEQAIELTEKNIKYDKDVYNNKLTHIFDSGSKWALHKLESLGTITSSKRIYKSEYKKTGVPFYRTKEIKELANNKVITKGLYISSQRYTQLKEKFGVPARGDLLVTAIGTIGEVYVVRDEGDFYFKDGNVLWLKDFALTNPYYLKYALQRFVSELNSLSNGSAYNALPIQKLKAYRIPVPSEGDQAEIVAQLDDLSDQTSKIQELHIKKLEHLNLLKQSLLAQAFSQDEVE